MKVLSKTNYILGLQCPKLLWTKTNKKERLPDINRALQHRFDEGHEVGKLATTLFKGGIDIETDYHENLKITKDLLPKRKTLFEPSLLIDYLYSRADILKPVGKDKWDIIEVKSSTKVKEVNLHDLSFQKYVYEKAGLKIRKCFLMHINNEYVRKGKVSAKKLFKIENVTKKVKEISTGIQDRILLQQEIISDKEPEVRINYDCKKPYPCPIMDNCWGFLPEHNHVFHLYRGGKKSFSLFEDGILEIVDIPDDFKLNVKQSIQKECAKTGKAHINKKGIKEFLETLEYPLYYLDFETYQIAIPLYQGLKPYQQIPFQYSLHIQKEKGGKLKHISYLAKGKKDPRKHFLKSLDKNLGDKGSIVVYNQSFEKMILRQLGEQFPEFEDWVESINGRIIDLYVPFRNFDYYHPKQKGSASLKKILPVLVGKDYKGMEIAEGGTASFEYLYITHVDSTDAKKVRKALEKYCKLDTLAEVWILERIENILSQEK